MNEQQDVQAAWQRIDRWLRSHAPDVLEDLNGPAAPAAIAAAEAKLELALPAALRASLAVHDGQSRDGPGLFPSGALLSVDTIVDERAIWMKLLRDGTFEGAR